jgi:hypothetical protein
MRITQILFAALFLVIPLISMANENYVATSDLKIRTGAGKDYSVSFTLQKGDEVEVLFKEGNWYQIKYLGQTGYAYSKYLRHKSDTNGFSSEQSDKRNSVIPILIILGIVILAWLLPILVIISSRKTTSGEKLAWVLAVLFISWFAWIFYMLLAPIKKKDDF